LLDRL